MKNALYYISRVRGAKRSWNNRHNRVLNSNINLNNSCDPEIEGDHINLWKDFRNKTNLTTLRICNNLSGVADPRMVPEDIFVSDIEPTLIIDESVHFLSHKSFYNHWFPKGIFPRDILHCINGEYLDTDLKAISFKSFKSRAKKISYPVIMKPNRDSYGGKDVYSVNDFETLINLSKQKDDFVIQERIIQHDYFDKFNPLGLNTIRVYVYKSVKDNSHHFLNATLRMGRGGSLDNETAGGIHTLINKYGYLNNYSVAKYGKKYLKHPDTGYSFDSQIPAFDDLKKMALKIAEQIYLTRIIGLDVCYDKNENWRVIEINTKAHTIRFSQYGGQPFFGDFTNEVIDYCKKNHWAMN